MENLRKLIMLMVVKMFMGSTIPVVGLWCREASAELKVPLISFDVGWPSFNRFDVMNVEITWL